MIARVIPLQKVRNYSLYSDSLNRPNAAEKKLIDFMTANPGLKDCRHNANACARYKSKD